MVVARTVKLLLFRRLLLLGEEEEEEEGFLSSLTAFTRSLVPHRPTTFWVQRHTKGTPLTDAASCTGRLQNYVNYFF